MNFSDSLKLSVVALISIMKLWHWTKSNCFSWIKTKAGHVEELIQNLGISCRMDFYQSDYATSRLHIKYYFTIILYF